MKIVVVLHIYYNELWEEFKTKLLNLETDFDLVVTLCETNVDISDEIKKAFPKAVILKFPNKGLDIGPFLKVIKYFKENKLSYDYLVKLHTKKSHYNVNLGTKWRNDLVNSLIGDKEKFEDNLALLERGEYKMCGSNTWLLTVNSDNFTRIFDLPRLKNKAASFIGGTMFIVDYDIIVNSFRIRDLDRLYDLMPEGYKRDFSYAHHMERILGFIVQNKGYKIIGV